MHAGGRGSVWAPSSPRSAMHTTLKIRSIGREARVNELISERLEHWKQAMRDRGIHPLSSPCARPIASHRVLSFCLSRENTSICRDPPLPALAPPSV